MDRGKRTSKFIVNRNSKIYIDLKDIIRDNALPFLPAKALFRCIAVCREWKLQISTPFFAHNQSISFQSVSGFFYQSLSGPPSFISLDPNAYGVPDPSLKFLPEPADIRCSSNGLLCCQGRTGYNAYYICNPVTKQWKKLPKPTANHGSNPALVLIFEPSLLNFSAEFKLVCAFESDMDGYEFEIYSSKEGSWRISGEIFFGNRKIIPGSGVHVNGSIYWLTHHCGIVAFDLTAERSKLLYGNGSSFLGEMNGKVCSAIVRGLGLTVSVLSNAFANTMQMNSHVNAWETKVSTTLDRSALGGDYERVTVLFANGDVVLMRGKTLSVYYLKTKEVACLGVEVGYDAKIVPYVNSIVEI